MTRAPMRARSAALAALAAFTTIGATADVPFSVQRLRDHVAWLASDDREGRGPGTRGLLESEHYVEAAFKKAGLVPAGDAGRFTQVFESPSGDARVSGADLTLGRTVLRFGEDFLPLAASDSGRVSGLLSASAASGKIVLLLPDSARASTQAPAVNAAWAARLLELRDAGAVGALAIVDSLPAPGGPGAEYDVVTATPRSARLDTGVAAAAGAGAGSPAEAPARPFVAALVTREAWRRAFGDVSPRSPDVDAAATLRVSIHREVFRLANVVGMIPGSDSALAAQPVILGAHYDHLGLVGPHHVVMNGADDNASGVAVLIEVAAALAREGHHRRAICCIAFSGEEEGLLGSAWFVAHAPFAVSSAAAMVNLDTVGRPTNGQVFALGTGTSADWRALVLAAKPESALVPVPVEDSFASSDQWSFRQRGIPAIQFFSGPNADYHRPTDDVDRIDFPGLARVATEVHNLVLALADRSEPLAPPVPGAGTQTGGTERPGSSASQRAWLGSIPDFSYTGPGVKITGVSTGSPAEAAGLHAGDVITAMNGDPIETLADLTTALKVHHSGEEVSVDYQRDGVTHQVRLTLKKRP